MKEFGQNLINDFPNLFPQKDGIVAPPICGIECPEEWQHTVYKLCESINLYIEKSYKIDNQGNKIYPPNVTIGQIKSKFNALRFYFSGGNDRIQGMVDFAEHLCDSLKNSKSNEKENE
jgi:hypothetical protein